MEPFVLTACDRFEEWFGRRADRVRKLYNSELECGFILFSESLLGQKTG